jgi:hypothetical protein
VLIKTSLKLLSKYDLYASSIFNPAPAKGAGQFFSYKARNFNRAFSRWRDLSSVFQ